MIVEEYKDFLGQTLSLDDTVIFPRKGYRRLSTGVVSKLGPKKATIILESNKTYKLFYNQFISIKTIIVHSTIKKLKNKGTYHDPI